MLGEINEISRVKLKPTKDNDTKSTMILDLVVRYHTSNMVFYADSNAAYLTMPEERSCYTGNVNLSDWP